MTNFTANSTSFSGFVYNAKEKDYESGFHYYGSRSYSSELSIWNSTDPMADKYPSLTPYNYCANNPVKLIDPNGEEIWTNNEGWHRIRDAIKSTLGNNAINDGNDEDKTNPFSFNGYKLNFQENKEFYNNLNEEQKVIFDNIKELVTDQTSSVLVQVVDKDYEFYDYKSKENTSLLKRKSVGYTLNYLSPPEDISRCYSIRRFKSTIYIDRNEQVGESHITTLHELGHAFYGKAGFSEPVNNIFTEKFERIVRDNYKGINEENIKTKEVKKH